MELSSVPLKLSAPTNPEEVTVMASVPLVPALMVRVAGELLTLKVLAPPDAVRLNVEEAALYVPSPE